MAGEEDRLATASECENDILHLAATDRIQSCRRLVEDDQIRIVDQRLGQADSTLHPFRKLAHRPCVGLAQADHLEQLSGSFAAFLFLKLEELSEKIECLLGIQKSVEVGLFGQVTDLRLGSHMTRRMAENLDMPLGGVEEPEQHLNGGRLPGSVGSQETENLTSANLEIDIVHRARLRSSPEVIEDLGQPTHRDHHLARGKRTPWWLRNRRAGESRIHTLTIVGSNTSRDKT